MKSISVIQRQTGNSKYIEYFRTLSVVQKAERMPYQVICRVFGESHSVAIAIVESIKKFGIVGVKRDVGAHANMYIIIHDLVLDVARSLVDKNAENQMLLMKWIYFRASEEDGSNYMEVNEVEACFE